MAETALRVKARQGLVRLEIGLLGPLSVRRDRRELAISGPKRRTLLTFLALNAGRPVGKDRLIEALWPDAQTGREEATLRTHISYLRDLIEPDRADGPVVLITRGQTYMLDRTQVELDVDRFRLLSAESREVLVSRPGEALARLDEALALWRGRPLLDVEYEEFAQDEIRNLERIRAETVVDRARALILCGDPGSAVVALEPLARQAPEWEEPVVTLMQALYGTGRQADALRTARRHRRHLADNGLEPSPRLVEVEDQILSHDPSLFGPGEGPVSGLGGSARGYELRDVLGEGSIGVVYRAFQPSVGREVALRVIRPDVAGSLDFVRRFLEEARTIGGLEHPHIVPLYDFWRDPTGAFVVMRLMRGGSLADRLDRRWEVSELVRAFVQVIDALSYAHSAGILHLDLRAANVLFDLAGNAYLSDFGLALWGAGRGTRPAARTTERGPRSAPETRFADFTTAADDVYGLGLLLAESSRALVGGERAAAAIEEIVGVATATDPGDRYPDVDALRRALADAVGEAPVHLPRRVRRNPYKGLSPFDEGDRVDFYGRDDFVERLVDAVASNSLVAVMAASGSGKSSVVRAGLIPELRHEAIPGSDEWFVVTMVPGVDPFEEFHIAMRDVTMMDPVLQGAHALDKELRASFDAALDGPSSRALLVIDQFEELFSSAVDSGSRSRFLDNLLDLATDPSERVRTVVTLRADFSDRPLSHPRLGDLLARSSLILGPMSTGELEDVIRRPASRVGIEIEPGLVAEIVRDTAEAPAALPLLQYILTELFERRAEDRLTVRAYRSLGGVRGVLERRAEAVFDSLSAPARSTCRQVFLRMVQLGDHGEETRCRVARADLAGLGGRETVDEVVDAFTSARILTTDRDPVSRTPTIEVSHEMVIARWTRFRVWIDESRTQLAAQRRLALAADIWAKSGESPEYLLTGGPLAGAVELASTPRVGLNELETRFVEASRQAAIEAQALERERQQRETYVVRRSRRRLAIGVGALVLAGAIGVLAGFVWIERQRAEELAAAEERQSSARELAAAAIANLESADPDLSLLLAVAAADLSIDAGEEMLPEVTDALHRAVIRPRPVLTVPGALGESDGETISYSPSGSLLAYVTSERTVAVIDTVAGFEVLRTDGVDPPVAGVDFHPFGARFLSIHVDGVREWDVTDGRMLRWLRHPTPVTTATYSDDGRQIAIGDGAGAVTIYEGDTEVATLSGEHEGPIASVDFEPGGTRLVSAGAGPGVFVWDITTETVTARPELRTELCVYEASWHPVHDEIVTTLCQGEAFAFDATTGARLRPYSQANQVHAAIGYDSSGSAVVGAGGDGVTRIFNAAIGGSSVIDLPSGGAPLGDVEFSPRDPAALEVAALGVDGTILIWRDGAAWSEVPHLFTGLYQPSIDATPDGRYYVVGGNRHLAGWPDCDDLTPHVLVVNAATDRVLATHATLCTLGSRHRVAISDDGGRIAGTARSGEVFVLDVGSGVSAEIAGSASWALDLDFSSDGALLAGVGLDGRVAVWSTDTLTEVTLLAPVGWLADKSSDRQLMEVEFVPGTYHLATVGTDGTVRIWDVGDGSNRILEEFGFPLISMDVSSDGRRLVAADSTGNLRILEVSTGEEILPRPQNVPGQTDIVFSPDGGSLAGGGPGPLVYVWDVGSGEIEQRLGRAIGAPEVAFVNGGSQIRSASIEGIVRGYVLDPGELLEIVRLMLRREMTDQECARYLHGPCQVAGTGKVAFPNVGALASWW